MIGCKLMLAILCMVMLRDKTRPLVLKYKEKYKSGMAVALLLLCFSLASYPLLANTRPLGLYYCIFGNIFTFLCFFFCYWFSPIKNKTVFILDEKGVYYCDINHGNESQCFRWQDLKQISIYRIPKETGMRGRLLCLTTQHDENFFFDLFPYVISSFGTIRRLKKAVNLFSKGSVLFKHDTIWNKSS